MRSIDLLLGDESEYTAYFDTSDGGNYDTSHETLEAAKSRVVRDVDSGKALQGVVHDKDDNEVFNYNPNGLGQ